MFVYRISPYIDLHRTRMGGCAATHRVCKSPPTQGAIDGKDTSVEGRGGAGSPH
jgi:hypothetical protein